MEEAVGDEAEFRGRDELHSSADLPAQQESEHLGRVQLSFKTDTELCPPLVALKKGKRESNGKYFGEEEVRGRPHCDLPIFEKTYKQEGERLLTRVDSDSSRGNGFKLRQGRCELDIRRKLFTQRVVMHWNRLPREVVDAPSLEAFKAGLDVAVSSLV